MKSKSIDGFFLVKYACQRCIRNQVGEEKSRIFEEGEKDRRAKRAQNPSFLRLQELEY